METSGKKDSQYLDLVAIQTGLYPGNQQESTAAAKADHDALVAGLSPAGLTITRLAAELPVSALTVDVKIGEAPDPSEIPGAPYSTQTIGTPPMCPPITTSSGGQGGSPQSMSSGDPGSSASASGGSSSGCQINRADSGGGAAGIAGLVAVAGLMASRLRRSRTRR